MIPLYRSANPAPVLWNVVKTLVVVAVFNAVVVWAIPTLVVSYQRESGDFDALFFPRQVVAGTIVLVLASAMVLSAAMMLALKGGGTPLSFDAPRRLVIRGPYGWLRAPMVTGTLMQGVGVGIMTGSIVVIVIFFVFALCWNTLVRPHEENQLQHLFGREFEAYRRNVRCWLPLRWAWTPPDDAPPITLDDTPDPNRQRRRKGRR